MAYGPHLRSPRPDLTCFSPPGGSLCGRLLSLVPALRTSLPLASSLRLPVSHARRSARLRSRRRTAHATCCAAPASAAPTCCCCQHPPRGLIGIDAPAAGTLPYRSLRRAVLAEQRQPNAPAAARPLLRSPAPGRPPLAARARARPPPQRHHHGGRPRCQPGACAQGGAAPHGAVDSRQCTACMACMACSGLDAGRAARMQQRRHA